MKPINNTNITISVIVAQITAPISLKYKTNGEIHIKLKRQPIKTICNKFFFNPKVIKILIAIIPLTTENKGNKTEY